jgi:hypothetical protein
VRRRPSPRVRRRRAQVVYVAGLALCALASWLVWRSAPPQPAQARALRYQPVPLSRVEAFYRSRGSRLATPAAAAAIEIAAWRHDLDPVVLVAITGQEQGFVPQSSDPRVARNPFNVYGCWCRTDIPLLTSANVAAATVATRLQCLPRAGSDLVVWINSRANPCVRREGPYAADAHWGPGVSRLYAEVAAHLGTAQSRRRYAG